MKLFNSAFMFEPSGDAGLTIVITLAIVLVSGGLIAFLFWRTRHDRLYFLDANTKKRIFTQEEIRKSLNISIILKNEFFLFSVTIRGYKDLVSLYGETNINEAVGRILDRIDTETPSGVRISHYEAGRILVYYKAHKDFVPTAVAKALKDLADRKTVLTNGATINIDTAVNMVHFPVDAESLDGIIGYLETGTVRAQPARSISDSDKAKAAINAEQNDLEEIRRAMANNEFCLYYHPIVSTKTLKVIGAESLIRWNKPGKGMLPPSAFLPVLERTGEIYKMGLWIFENAAKQLLEWRTKGYKDIWISINLSLKQLNNLDIIKEFSRILRKYDVEPADFYFEIYDISVYSRVEVVKSVIDRFAQLGFKLSVDKFGRATSSLTELANLPLAQIKVDMAFLEHAKENLLYSGVINALNEYVKQNDMMMVADGVETKAELEWAGQNGIMFLQGFYFSRPVDADEFERDVINKCWLPPDKQPKPVVKAEENKTEKPEDFASTDETKSAEPKSEVKIETTEKAVDKAKPAAETQKTDETEVEKPATKGRKSAAKKTETDTTGAKTGSKSTTTKRTLSLSKESSLSHIDSGKGKKS